MNRDRLPRLNLMIALLMPIILAACAGPRATAGTMQVEIQADGGNQTLSLPIGSTVQQAIEAAGVHVDAFDRVEPPSYTLLTEGSTVKITRVSESFEIEEIVIPFERQIIRNEALPKGETRLLQPGANGLQEITYRILQEEGLEISRSAVKSVVIQEPIPEILMVGLQAAYTPLPIDGKLAYVSGGNAWLIQGDTGNRRPLVLSGDMDGRVFRLSPDGRWLLFTRQAEEGENIINSLWAISTTNSEAESIDLKASNIIHFADWIPSTPSLTVAYSTVEPSPAAPGWQANNDLIMVTFTSAGAVLKPSTLVEANAGGQYGWWGTNFAWGRDSRHLAFARADGVGLVDLEYQVFEPLLELIPYQTLSDWAWVPGLAWGQDNRTLFFVDHGEPVGLESPEASPVFNLVAIPGTGGSPLSLASRAGMFAYPSVSPIVELSNGEISYQIAYLQAVSPLESEDSSYRLMVMDRDGSNERALFPPPGEPGLDPQQTAWSPNADRIAFSYRGDLWVIDVASGIGQPLTGDSQTLNYDWKP
jgi:hypothetical protein